MKIYYPLYYSEFSCLAGKCPDSCCRTWEIVIDENTYKRYNTLSGNFAEKIKGFIVNDSDGDKCFSLVDGRCPFLNSDCLCDIHINLGEDYTSEICRMHPRFVEEYDGFTEISLSLSCPEASRLIFSTALNENYYPSPDYSGDDEVLRLLISSREKLLYGNNDFNIFVSSILNTSADDSLDIDMVYISDFPVFDADFMLHYIKELRNLEILTEEWKKLLDGCVDMDSSQNILRHSVEMNNDNLCRFAEYLVYRYYLKAVNDLDIYSRALFITASCYLCSYLSAVNDIPFEETARLFSKETEHNLENIDRIIEYFSDF